MKISSPAFEEVTVRLKSLLGLGSDAALAEALGIRRTTFVHQKKRGDLPRAEIDTLCEAGGISKEWVYTGEGQPRPRAVEDAMGALKSAIEAARAMHLDEHDTRQLSELLTLVNLRRRDLLLPQVRKLQYMLVPRLEITASAGGGAVQVSSPSVVDYMAFDPQWVRRATGSDGGELAIIEVRGDSMESTLHDGDLVIIERGRPRAISPGVYVLARDDVLLIKRLHLRADGRVEIRSDNKSYPTETMSGAEFDALHIVGRMIRRVVR